MLLTVETESPQRSSEIIRVLMILGLSVCVYIPSLLNGFAFDDLIHLGSPFVKNPDELLKIFLSPTYPGNLYRPVLTLSYAITAKLFGLSPFVLHFDNIILHAANAVVVYGILRRYFSREIAFWSAVIFAVHPLNSEAVANISGRSELLVGFFTLCSTFIVQQLSSPAWKPRHLLLIPLVGVAACAAAFSKESALVLIVIIPLAVAMLGAERLRSPGFILGFAAACIGLTAAMWARSAVVGFPNVGVNSSHALMLDNPLAQLGIGERVADAWALLGYAAARVLAPLPLSADYSFAVIDPGTMWSNGETWLWLVVSSGFGLIALLSIVRDEELSFCLLWFFGCFAVTSNILFPIGTIFAERLVYLPGIGIVTLCVVLSQRLLALVPRHLFIGCFALLLGYHTFSHVKVWRDNATLFTYQIKVSEKSAKTQHNYGIVLRNAGDFDNASIHFRRALEIFPQYTDAAYGLASTYALKGLTNGAAHWLNEALSWDGEHVDSLILSGRLLLNDGKLDEASERFDRVLALDSLSFSARLGSLAVAIKRNDLEGAKRLRQDLMAQNPDDKELVLLSAKLDELFHVP